MTSPRLLLQVRCAAVFALGTFVGNSAERTDHSTTIDHNVAMMLAQLINDGSPVVRKVRGPQVRRQQQSALRPISCGARGSEPATPTAAASPHVPLGAHPLESRPLNVCLIFYKMRFFTRYSCVCFI